MERFGIRLKVEITLVVSNNFTLCQAELHEAEEFHIFLEMFLYQFLGQIVVLCGLKTRKKSQPNRSKTEAVRDVRPYPGLWPTQSVPTANIFHEMGVFSV